MDLISILSSYAVWVHFFRVIASRTFLTSGYNYVSVENNVFNRLALLLISTLTDYLDSF